MVNYLESKIPDPIIRRAVLTSLADTIEKINNLSPSCWGLNKYCFLQFTWKGFQTPYIWWVEDGNTGKVFFHLEKEDVLALSEQERKLLETEATITDNPNWYQAYICLPKQAELFKLVNRLFYCYIDKKIGSQPNKVLIKACQSTHRDYGVGYVEYLRKFLNRPEIPQPGYMTIQVPPDEGEPPKDRDIFDTVDGYLKAKGYYFTAPQIKSFYTALQTKGFVILSGISGTGKTKLAQLFAEMLPAPTHKKVEKLDDVISITLQPDHMLRHRFIIPRQYIGYFEPIEPNKRVDISLTFNGKTQQCWMKSYDYPSRTPYLMFWLQGEAVEWISQNYKVDDTLLLKPDSMDDKLRGLTVLSNQEEDVTEEKGSNCLFLSVRPDWRDSKSLLGYFNPLTRHYESTPFLEFLLKARRSFEMKDDLAWFVILDEMNLARVEYYFADLLSVLESGRDDNGNTRETLRFIYGDMEEGEIPPPAEMALPPNLYVIGTVNVDETTQSFSPKVLDRAFSLEFVDVDFDRYASSIKGDGVSWDRQNDGQGLLKEFTRDNTFVRIDKEEIKAFVQTHPEFPLKLQSLNQKLQPYTMHFGYRVFDEIMMFLKNAEANGMKDAFDHAVLMKVLPKFHGSRGKLEKPLVVVLVWCAKIKSLDAEPVKKALSDPEVEIILEDWECPATASRVLRMLQSLNSTGFASFG